MIVSVKQLCSFSILTYIMTLGSPNNASHFTNPSDDPAQQAGRPQSLSQFYNFDEVWIGFNRETKKYFHKTIDNSLKLQRIRSTLWFLKQCVQAKIIPKSFQINATPDSRFTTVGKAKWAQNIKVIEVSNLKVAISEQQNIELRVELREIFFFNRELSGHKQKLLKLSQSKVVVPTESETSKDCKKNRRWLKRTKFRRKQKRLSRIPLEDIYINYSDTELSVEQQSLLNKHLSFVPVPDKVNVTQLQYDISRFSRGMRWVEQHGGEEFVRPDNIFPVKKHNLPRQAPSPALSKFLYGVQTDLLSEQTHTRPNLTVAEKDGMAKLIQAQKDGHIVIQRCDKGGATAIMNRDDYVKGVVNEHLKSTVTNLEGETISVYREVDPIMLGVHHERLKQLSLEALQAGVITEDVQKALVPDSPTEARAYGMHI